jgi:hypothetical protein
MLGDQALEGLSGHSYERTVSSERREMPLPQGTEQGFYSAGYQCARQFRPCFHGQVPILLALKSIYGDPRSDVTFKRRLPFLELARDGLATPRIPFRLHLSIAVCKITRCRIWLNIMRRPAAAGA